jgi:hypothetical protein
MPLFDYVIGDGGVILADARQCTRWIVYALEIKSSPSTMNPVLLPAAFCALLAASPALSQVIENTSAWSMDAEAARLSNGNIMFIADRLCAWRLVGRFVPYRSECKPTMLPSVSKISAIKPY